MDFTASLQLLWGLSGASFSRSAAKALGSMLRGETSIKRSSLALGVCSPLLPSDATLPHALGICNVALTCLLSRLDSAALLLLVTAFLCERRILLLSQTPPVASAATLALLQLMRPLQWCHTCIPYLPLHLATHISAPQPLIMGASPDHLATLTRELGPSAVGPMLLVDLDSGCVMSTNDAQPLPDVTSRAGGGRISHHTPRAAAEAQRNTSHVHAAATRFAAAHAAEGEARLAAKALASALPGPLSPAAAPLPGRQPAAAAHGVSLHALQTLSQQWTNAVQLLASAPRAAAEASLVTLDSRGAASLGAAHSVLHTLRSLAPHTPPHGSKPAADMTSDLLGIKLPKTAAPAVAPAEPLPPTQSAAVGSREYTGPSLQTPALPHCACSFMQAVSPLVAHTAATHSSAHLPGEGRGVPSGTAAPEQSGGSGGYLNKLGRKLKHSIASSSLGQAVGREVRHIRSEAPSQADMWRPHESLLRQGGESLGERLARELEDAYNKARAVGYFDEAHVRGSMLAFLSLLLSSAHTCVTATASGASASLMWHPEHFAESVMDARMRLLASEVSSSQLLCSFALGMFAANAGLVPEDVPDASRHPALHKQGHFVNASGQKLFLSTLLAGHQLLRDDLWRVALGSDAQLRTCGVASHTFGDVRRRVVEALQVKAQASRVSAMKHLLVATAGPQEGTGAAEAAEAVLAANLRILGQFSRELGGVGLRAAAADWALWRPPGCSLSTDQVVAAANEGGAVANSPAGSLGDFKGLVDLLLAASSDSTPSSHEMRQVHQLVALLSHLPAARSVIAGVALLRLSDCATSKTALVPVQGGPTADAVRHGAMPFDAAAAQWQWASWRHGILGSNLLLCMLLHGAPAARATVQLLQPLMCALLHPSLGNLTAATLCVSNLAGTLEGAAIASAASFARARRSTARSIAAKVAFGLSGGRSATSAYAAEGLGSGQSLLGCDSAAGAAWCGEPPAGRASSTAPPALPDSVQALLQHSHSSDSMAALTANALNVKSALENGHASGLGLGAGHLQHLQAVKPRHGVATLKASLRLLLRLLADSSAWYRTRLAAQQAGSLLPGAVGGGVVTGAPCDTSSADLLLARSVSSCQSLHLPAPLPAVVDMRACALHMAGGQRVLHPWDLDFMQLRGESVLLKRVPRVPLSAFRELPRVLDTVSGYEEPESPPASSDASPVAGVLPVSEAMSKLHSMFMPVGWNSRSQPLPMRFSSQRSPPYVQGIIATYLASSAITLQGEQSSGGVPLQPVSSGLGGKGFSKLKHRRARSVAHGPTIPHEVQVSDFDLFDMTPAEAPARPPQRGGGQETHTGGAKQAQPPAHTAAAEDAWGSEFVFFD